MVVGYQHFRKHPYISPKREYLPQMPYKFTLWEFLTYFYICSSAAMVAAYVRKNPPPKIAKKFAPESLHLRYLNFLVNNDTKNLHLRCLHLDTKPYLFKGSIFRFHLRYLIFGSFGDTHSEPQRDPNLSEDFHPGAGDACERRLGEVGGLGTCFKPIMATLQETNIAMENPPF